MKIVYVVLVIDKYNDTFYYVDQVFLTREDADAHVAEQTEFLDHDEVYVIKPSGLEGILL